MTWLDDQLLFFDLAGTLVDIDSSLSESNASVLREVGRRARRVVLVTGQSSDDPQLCQLIDLFREISAAKFAAYVTRGGRRLVLSNGGLEEDTEYLRRTSLDGHLKRVIPMLVQETLAELRLETLIPVQCMDEVAIRVNLTPDHRKEFTETLIDRMPAAGLAHLQAVSEGRTSVFIMRKGVGKRLAVENELRLSRTAGNTSKAFYVGNEFYPGGNDREVLGIDGLEVMALGPIGAIPEGATCQVIGESPADLYAALASAITPRREPKTFRLPVVCLSLGGTKIQVGSLTAEGVCLSSAAVHWRESERYRPTAEASTARPFCNELVENVLTFVRSRGYGWHDVGVLGVAFPGPCEDGRWYSNNLPSAFRQGVDLEMELRAAVKRNVPNGRDVPIRVLFDAQCDAGGELYHPKGQLFPRGYAVRCDQATVLNLATGVAAGFIKNGQVLVGDEDFRREVGSNYDAGAGQLGRHLWYYPADGQWRYHIAPNGRVPVVEGAIRMTDRLSGPALAARLLWRLGQASLLPDQTTWNASVVTVRDVEEFFHELVDFDPNGDLGHGALLMRASPLPIATELLSWADLIYCGDDRNAWHHTVAAFAKDIARDLASALTCWMTVPEWEPYGRIVILTGGVGLRFLASSDCREDRSFIVMLQRSLPSSCAVQRSRLGNAIERESYMFLCGATAQGEPK